ncbi:MAG: alpha/beta hydrolase [Spirochaetes bacterium]|nr:MAG: alpha/beta hydrolase [Spirochaetota bacterium]
MIKRILVATAVLLTLVAVIVFFLGTHWQRTEFGKLDFKAAILLKMRSALQEKAAPKVARLRADEASRGKSLQEHPMAVARIRDMEMPGGAGAIPLRVYTPSGNAPFPILLFFHGGGWVMGDLDSADSACRFLANTVLCVVVSVDYRLAPEHPFPAAIDDCYAALVWVHANGKTLDGDPGRIGVAGMSAGANLAAAAALMARDKAGPRISCQALAYPAVNLSALDTPSFRHFAEGYGLTSEMVDFFIRCYLFDETAGKNPYASPLLAGNFSKLPPAIVITAGFDVLHDEGREYAERLNAAGVNTVYSDYPTMIHGFLNMGKVFPEANAALSEIAAFAARTLRD